MKEQLILFKRPIFRISEFHFYKKKKEKEKARMLFRKRKGKELINEKETRNENKIKNFSSISYISLRKIPYEVLSFLALLKTKLNQSNISKE